jgi:hypothetical protein
MNKVIGVGLSVLVNAALLVALQWNDHAQHAAPSGEVQVTQLDAQQPDISRDWLLAQTRA